MFDFLFKRGTAEEASTRHEETNAPGTGIRYDAGLVSELKSDHVKLVDLFKEILGATSKKDSQMLVSRLTQFGGALRGHLLKENVRFYVYLRNSLQSDESSLSIMNGFVQEMNQIGRAVTEFLGKYTNVAQWDDAQWSVFERDLKAVGEVLTKRIETEESTLYPLYMPPGSYS